MKDAVERSTMWKVYLRLLPLTALMYFLCYIDRINVSFAALTMNQDIGLTAAAYGFSSTAFYIGYVLFEMPSNLIMHKVGARLWLARIMITWGIASAATACVVGPTSFLIVRCFWVWARPGCFPASSCCSLIGSPTRTGPHRRPIHLGPTCSVALGAPISTAILGMDGVLGLKGGSGSISWKPYPRS